MCTAPLVMSQQEIILSRIGHKNEKRFLTTVIKVNLSHVNWMFYISLLMKVWPTLDVGAVWILDPDRWIQNSVDDLEQKVNLLMLDTSVNMNMLM